MNKNYLISLFLIIGFISCAKKNDISIKKYQDIFVAGVEKPIISLNGKWKFSMTPPEGFELNKTSFKEWSNIQVPGECAMQGFPIKHDQPYAYKKEILIPQDYKEKIIKLKFDGVYSYARVWVNGNYVRDHSGGFTPWECDISDFVKPGQHAILTVEITDKTNDLSYGSGYAKHQIGGILRKVTLQALPKIHFEHVYYETEMIDNYENANLKIDYKLIGGDAKLVFKIFDPKLDEIIIDNTSFNLIEGEQVLSIPINNPIKWDAEHPNLYTIVTELSQSDDKHLYSASHKIGFREVKVDGNLLLVNGAPIKLRGANRHDVHPTLGRTSTPEYDELDVKLTKESNMNYIRTSHYPPTEEFLNFCDKYGIYVEDESAVCFVNMHRSPPYGNTKQSGIDFESHYLSQVQEMIHYHRNHPSVIMWSMGNETKYDLSLQASFDYARESDSSRPIIFSYPDTVPDSLNNYDILSKHYPLFSSIHDSTVINSAYKEMPVLYDEWAHVPCYNYATLRLEQGVREFWGQSLDKMWTNVFNTKGALGGGIWGMIDETFMMPESLAGYNNWWGIQELRNGEEVYSGPTIGYGEWGIIDTWRRKKPEFWGTKKAYSPTRITTKNITHFKPGEDLKIVVQNRFDHTNFNEIKILWSYSNVNGEIIDMDLSPHETGIITIPQNNWEHGKKVNIKFISQMNDLIDEYNLILGKVKSVMPELAKGEFKYEETEIAVKYLFNNVSFNLNKNTGLIENYVVVNDTLIKSGPYLNIMLFGKDNWSTLKIDDFAQNWTLEKCSYKIKDGFVFIKTSGNYEDDIKVIYNIKCDSQGILEIEYSVNNKFVDKYLKEEGLKFKIGDQNNNIFWQRDSYWSSYPENHIGRNIGSLNLKKKGFNNYRTQPKHSWELDTKEYFYNGLEKEFHYSRDARSLKENIYYYTIQNKNSHLTVFGDSDKACRVYREGSEDILVINSQWDYLAIKWGNYAKVIKLEKKYSNTVSMKIEKNE